MNRSAIGPQSLRPLPNGFPSQTQISQNRSATSRLPPGSKMTAANGATWAFGGGIPMGNVGLGGPRPGPMSSFAQTIGSSSQPSTPLDLSEFPSLSDNQPQTSQSTWAASGARSIDPSSNLRLLQQPTLSVPQQLNSQQPSQQQPEDLFSSSSQLPASQSGFKLGVQNTVSQTLHSNSADEFPPLNRNTNGDIGQDRGPNMIQSAVFPAQSNRLGVGSSNTSSSSRSNGLLNALSSSARVNSLNISAGRVTSSSGLSGVPSSRPLNEVNLNDVPDRDTSFFSSTKPGPREVNLHTLMSRQDISQHSDLSSQRAQNADPNILNKLDESDSPEAEVQDILSGMIDIDRWGLKGLSMMMNNFPAFAALVTGSDLTSFGLDLGSSELVSNQVYSLWDNEPPRPVLPHYKLPECYTVTNVAQLETKMANLNDEALIFMFYSSPGDLQQVMAAQELHNRNWRYHKKLQLWLTKDEMMVPQTIGNGTERGYYIFFDIKNWQRERREFTLVYDDLESLPNANPRLG